MAGSRWEARVPSDLDRDLAEYKREQGIEEQSEAVRQVFRRGIKDWREEQQAKQEGRRWSLVFYRLTELLVVSAVLSLLLYLGLNDGQLLSVGGSAALGAVLTGVGYLFVTNHEDSTPL
jgi:hypothetical protein